MRKFLLKVFLFMLPFILLGLINLAVDPYARYSILFREFDRKAVALPTNYRQYKLAQYLCNPVDRIILGDSRAAALDTELIRNVSGKNYYNFGYGSGSMEEAFTTIEFAETRIKLKEIIIVIPFNLMDSSNQKNLVLPAIKTLDNSLSYVLNYSTTKASYRLIYYEITGINKASERPNLNKAEFWNAQLTSADSHYKQYSYSAEYIRRLRNLSEKCIKQNIGLTFIIPPTHIELQRLINTNQLSDDWHDYLTKLNQFGITYNFDIESDVTKDYNNFKDPYHYNDQLMREIIHVIWGELDIEDMMRLKTARQNVGGITKNKRN